MDQRVSRPVRWRGAISRAQDAARGVRELHEQWATKLGELRQKLEELRSRQTIMSEESKYALGDLIDVQDEYDSWKRNLPECQWGSRTEAKLEEVEDFDFKGWRENIPQLEKFAVEDELEKFLEELSDGSVDDPFEKLLSELYYAKRTDLPKGWGRD